MDSTYLEKSKSEGSDSAIMSTAGGDPRAAAVPPDGGILAWSQVLAGHLINMVTWGYITGFGIGGAQVFLLFSLGTLSGRATDAGLGRLMVFLGSLLLLSGTFMTSLATTYWQIFLAQGLCVGTGLGMIWLPSLTMISTYFIRNRTLAVASAAAGTSTGSMIFSAMVQYLTPQIGFPWAVRCMGFVVLFITIVFNTLLRTRLPPRRSGRLVEWSAFKEAPYVLFTIGVFLLYWPIYFAFFYIQAYAHDHLGFSNSKSVDLVIIVNAVGLPVRPIAGFLADRYFGPLNSLIPCAALCGILTYCWITVHNAAGLYTFAIIYGTTSAAAMCLFAGTVPSLTKDLDKIGTRVGMVLTLMSLGPLTGQSVAGALIQGDGGSYLPAQLWGGSSMLLGTVALVMARLWTSGWHLKVKL